jgi:hypothetical protein
LVPYGRSAIGSASQSCGPVSLLGDATVQQQPQAVVDEVAKAVPDALDLFGPKPD